MNDINENIIISTNNVLQSEYSEDLASLTAKFLICTFEPNENNVMINRKTVTNWLSTLVNQPVVAKIGITDSGLGDFTSHNLRSVVREDENGNAYKDLEFDTEAFGVFTDVGIETIKGKECITATTKLWKRFPNFIAVIKRRLNENIPIATSWEISVKKSHYETINGKQIKVIDDGQFLGHCLLAKVVPPAYKESQLLEVAEKNNDVELFNALVKDISHEYVNINSDENKEDKVLDNIDNQVVDNTNADNVNAGNTNNIESTTIENNVTSALTEYDLRKALRKAIAEKLNKDQWDFYIIYHFPADGVVWCQLYDAESELDIIMFTYTVENDVVTVSEPVTGKLTVSVSQINDTVAQYETKIMEQTNALLEANNKIQSLNTTVAELMSYKEKFEKAEQERIEREMAEQREKLKAYALKSGFISVEEIESSADIKSYIDTLNEKEINNIIAERFMESLKENNNVSTSAANENNTETQIGAKLNVTDDGSDGIIDAKAIVRKFIKK